MAALPDEEVLPETHYRNLKGRIRYAVAKRKRSLNCSGLESLESLPEEIAQLTWLTALDLRGTRVSDFSILTSLPLRTLNVSGLPILDATSLSRICQLENLNISDTLISDIGPLRLLQRLKRLSLAGTKVSDLSPLADLNRLQELDLDRSPIDRLEPLRNHPSLCVVSLRGTRVRDIAPMGTLNALTKLNLAGTQVRDLSPLAVLTSLADAAASTGWWSHDAPGLVFENTPAATSLPFQNILLTRYRPAHTVETINVLRRQQGLPAHIPENYRRPNEFEDLLTQREHDAEYDNAAEAVAALEQGPAAYSFQFQNGRFRARAQISPPDDLALASDIYTDLKEKAIEAQGRLIGSNAPIRLRNAIDRLIADLGEQVEDAAPGKLLMRSRSLDAVISAYDTVEARREIAEDALAQITDVATSLADLKSCYPSITRLEAARVAQDLLTKDVGATLAHMANIREMAAASDVVDPSAVEALRVGEPEIEHTNEIIADKAVSESARITASEKRAETAAQMLLDHRNFVASVLKSASDLFAKAKGPSTAVAEGLVEVTSESLQQFKKKAPDPLSDAMVATGVGALVGAILGPAVGIAAFLATYKPLARKGAQLANAATELVKLRSKGRRSTDEDTAESK